MTDVVVYLQDGRTRTYQVENCIKAREHAHRIVNYGWRDIENGVMCYYPTHQVLKVKFKMDKLDKLATEYEAK